MLLVMGAFKYVCYDIVYELNFVQLVTLSLSLSFSLSLLLSLPLSPLPLPLSLSFPKQFVMITCLKMKNCSSDFEKMMAPMKSLLIQQLLQRDSEYTASKSTLLCMITAAPGYLCSTLVSLSCLICLG